MIEEANPELKGFFPLMIHAIIPKNQLAYKPKNQLCFMLYDGWLAQQIC